MEPAHRSRLVPVAVTVVAASVAFAFVFTGDGVAPSTTIPPLPLSANTTPAPTTAFTTSSPSTRTTPSTTVERAAPEPLPPGWERIDGGPLTARFGTAAVWMDGALVLWGGGPLDVGASTDGAVFRRGRTGGPWEAMPPPPLVAGDRAILVRAGERIFVGGGRSTALYDPVDAEWELLDPPEPTLTRPLTAAWTGSEVIVIGHTSTALGSARLAGVAYTTEGVCCREIAAPPVDLTTAWTFWTGDRLLLVGGRFDITTNRPLDPRPGFAAYDPATDRWEVHDGPESLEGVQALAAAWNGEELVLWDYLTTAAAWRPDRGWRSLPNVPVPFAECYPDTVAAADGRVFALYCGEAAYYEPTADRWIRIAAPATPREAPRSCALAGAVDDAADVFLWCTPIDGSDPVLFTVDLDAVEVVDIGEPARPSEWELVPNPQWAERASASLVWTGLELLVWGGFDGVSEVFGGWAYDPATGVMHRIPDAPAPGRPGQSAVWTGSEVVVWRGTVTAWDPIDLEWRVIEPSTPRIQLHPGNTALWTGTDVLFWGASQFVGGSEGGAALDITTGEWRGLPPSPIGPRTNALVVWSGEEMYIWGGLAFGAESWEQQGAAYDPAADEWRSLPPLPGGLQIAGPVGGWVDGELIVVGQRAGRADDTTDDTVQGDVIHVAGAAYDPERDAWRVIADLPGPTWPGEGLAVSMSAVEFGSHLAVWLTAEYFGDEPGIAIYDPRRDAWTRWDGAPADAYGPPLVAAGGRVAALTRDGLLILTPAR